MKIGKYEKIAVKTPKAPQNTLQTYMTSLLSLVLCCTMFLSTTFAWFTSEVVNEGNALYIGTLKVVLDCYDEDSDDFQAMDNNSDPIFPDSIRWEPGHTEYRYFKLTNAGDLAFNYKLHAFLADDAAATLSNTMTPQELANQFDVYVKVSDTAIEKTETLEGWDKVGTLEEVLFKGKDILRGSMDGNENEQHYFAVALQMKLEADAASMGNTLNGISIRLVAAQKAYEYVEYEEVEVTEPDLSKIDFAPNTIYYLTGTEYTVSANETLCIDVSNVVLKGSGADVTVINAGETSCSGQAALFISGNNVTVQDLTIKTASENGAVAAVKVSDVNDAEGVVKDVTLKNLVVVGSKGHGVNLHGVDGATIDNVAIAQFGKCGISLAKATNVVITNSMTAAGGWADIGCMYPTNNPNNLPVAELEGSTYNAPCSLTIDASNSFGNGMIYSERPSTATGGKDKVTYPEGWQMDGSDAGWVLTLGN